MEMVSQADLESNPDTSITVQVKFAGRTIPVPVPAESAVRELKSLLQPLTNVLPRGQKLIFKGKVLEDSATLRSNKITNGSKIMMIASQGLHQGEGPITKQNENISLPTKTKTENISSPSKSKTISKKDDDLIEKNKIITLPTDRWKITGVVALKECQLQAVPEEVWACGDTIRMLDLSCNYVQRIPMKINALVSLKRLALNGNNLSEENICWEGLVSLKSLTYLNMNNNRLTNLPSSLGKLISLRQLHVANNKLTNLPFEIESLIQLENLEACNNRISSLPLSIGNCISLIEINMSYNLLTELPETLGDLYNLKALYVRNNGLKNLPSTLIKGCLQLSILDLHGTEITNDILRQVDGWEDFDRRRRSKNQKQLDFRVGFSGYFDEGADDDNNNSHY